jgi:Ca2+/Na+ antiporter
MINRFRLFHQNMGTGNTLIWVVVLGYFVWVTTQNFNPVGMVVMFSIMGLCLIAPLAIMPLCERNPYRASRIARGLQFMILGYIALSFFNVFQIPAPWSMLFILFLFLMFGWTFWFHSSPRVWSVNRVTRYQNQMLAAEEAALNAEIASNQRELDAMDDPRGSRGH